MRIARPICKYIIAFVLSAVTFVCGYHFKHWHTAKYRTKKYISLIYSCSEHEIGRESFELLLKKEFRAHGVEPVMDKFYLDCSHYDHKDTTDHIVKYLDILKDKPVDLLLTVGDQAASSVLSTGHRLLQSLPVVACNVHFPDEKLIGKYDSRKLYVLRDRPDFGRNIEFIRSLQPDADMEIVFNTDLTPLGHKSFDLLSKTLDRRNVQILGHKSAFSMEYEYEEMREMTAYYNLMPALAADKRKDEKLTVSLCPFRYIKGASLLTMMEHSKNEQEKKAFLLDKFDLMALPIVNAVNIPSFSCIREGFGKGSKIVGGYMSTDRISAHAAAELSVRLMNREKIGMPKIRDLQKEYVLNYRSLSAYEGYHLTNAPRNTRIIDYPFYEHYRGEIYLVGAAFIAAFIILSISLLRIRRRAMNERRNMQILEEAHKRLTLSADGGQISLWNMQGGDIEFDDNFTRLTGMQKRLFEKSDLLEYVHPEDLHLLRKLYDALQQSPGVQVRRIRFCFGKMAACQWYELRCRSLKNAKGEMMLAGILHNIEELVKREQQLIEAKQMAEKAELKQSFLNNISHEIRTPLNAIVGFTNVLTGEGCEELDPDEKAAMLHAVNLNNELLLKLINDILEISHLDSNNMDFEMAEWDMAELVEAIYKAHQPLIRPELQFRFAPGGKSPVPVCIDRVRFTQVITNFLNNAGKFTRDGEITLGYEVDEAQREVCVYVKDTGIGIDEKELTMIFDRFYKSDAFEQGSGLGLPICKVIIERLSGRIEVHSEGGKGSCFTAILPLADRTRGEEESAA